MDDTTSTTGTRVRTARATARPPQPDAENTGGPRNEVLLVGRVSAAPEERELPSGDLLSSWRLVVNRGPSRRPLPDGVRSPTIDTLACVAWTAKLRRVAAALEPGDVVEVTGALRQRYWRAGAALASRTEVEVLTLRRLSRGA